MRSRKQFHALHYHGGNRRNAVAKRQYLVWRASQVPALSERCDNPDCQFHSAPLVWGGSPLPLILEHINGVNTDNRPSNLRLLCPNCDSQNIATRGGANAGRVIKSAGGFALVSRDGLRHCVLPAESGTYQVIGSNAKLIGPAGVRCESKHMTPNPSLHLTFASPPRGLSPAGELKR